MPGDCQCTRQSVTGKGLVFWPVVALFSLALLVSAGCSRHHKPAPVVDRSLHKPTARTSGRRAQAQQKSRIVIGPSYGTKVPRQVTVRRGETLYSICFRYNLDLKQVAQLNHLKPPYTIYPGQKLLLKANRSRKKTAASGGGAAPKASIKKIRPDVVVHSSGSRKPAVGTGGTHGARTGQARAAGEKKRQADKNSQVAAKKPGKKPVLKNPAKWIWPASGHLISSYSPSDPARKGIVIAGQPGYPVKAAADGVVVYTGNALKAYGQLIIIKHSDTYLSAYGYNRRSLVKEGQAVRQGQKIGEMGASPSGKPGLRFEIRKNGQPVNPLSRLPKR